MTVKKEFQVSDYKKEPLRRLSVDLPKSLHTRFKTACAKADTKMVNEIMKFLLRRCAELESQK